MTNGKTYRPMARVTCLSLRDLFGRRPLTLTEVAFRFVVFRFFAITAD
jgi:hypothetical protein